MAVTIPQPRALVHQAFCLDTLRYRDRADTFGHFWPPIGISLAFFSAHHPLESATPARKGFEPKLGEGWRV